MERGNNAGRFYAQFYSVAQPARRAGYRRSWLRPGLALAAGRPLPEGAAWAHPLLLVIGNADRGGYRLHAWRAGGAGIRLALGLLSCWHPRPDRCLPGVAFERT